MIVGVLGGIGAGKTAIAHLLADCAAERARVETIDADALAHAALNSADVATEIRKWLGDAAFDTEGRVDRQAVGRLVFNDGDKLKHLESLIHPVVRDGIAARLAAFRADASGPFDLCILDVPLLATSPVRSQCDSIVYVDVDHETRERRVMENRGWEAGELARREQFQASPEEKRQLADYVIDNSGPLDGPTSTTREQVKTYLEQLFQSGSQVAEKGSAGASNEPNGSMSTTVRRAAPVKK